MRIFVKTLLFLGLSTFAAIPQARAADAMPIGFATETQGSVLVERKIACDAPVPCGSPQPLNSGDPIFLNDLILTDEGDHAEIEFVDKTTIAQNGAEGKLSIDEYVYDPENPAENKARYNVLRASFKYVSGLIAKENNDVEIGLDFGSIGIRGTTIYRSMKDEECWIYLEEGKIQVKNKAGYVTLNPDDGTRLRSKSLAPLPAKPWSAEKIAWIKSEVAKPE